MVCVVYSVNEERSRALGERLVKILGAKQVDSLEGRKIYKAGKVDIIETEKLVIYEDAIDSILESDYIIFLSRHSSAKGVASFTVHSTGNWSQNVDIGGKPSELSIASPLEMLDILQRINKLNYTEVPLTYEATHHGPFLDKPSFFVEVGGSDKIAQEHYDIVASAVRDHLVGKTNKNVKVAFGIGGTHYPEKFTKLGLSGEYAFSHIIPRHYCQQLEMLEKGLKRSVPQAQCAVVDWKGVGSSEERLNVVKKLDELGIDYVKV